VPFGSYTGTLEAVSITGPSEDIQLYTIKRGV